MEVICSLCMDKPGEKVVSSTVMPGARFVSCTKCLDDGREPRPLVVLGHIYGNRDVAKKMIKYHLYSGSEILATEILD